MNFFSEGSHTELAGLFCEALNPNFSEDTEAFHFCYSELWRYIPHPRALPDILEVLTHVGVINNAYRGAFMPPGPLDVGYDYVSCIDTDLGTVPVDRLQAFDADDMRALLPELSAVQDLLIDFLVWHRLLAWVENATRDAGIVLEPTHCTWMRFSPPQEPHFVSLGALYGAVQAVFGNSYAAKNKLKAVSFQACGNLVINYLQSIKRAGLEVYCNPRKLHWSTLELLTFNNVLGIEDPATYKWYIKTMPK